MPTTDEWYPNFDGNKVELSKIPMLDGTYRVCVWGKDDFGMEYDTTELQKALDMFNHLKTQTDITTQMLTKLGFENA